MQSRHGFTLLELLLAITILGTVVLVALGAFRIGQRSWEKGDAVAENNQRLRVAVERMRQQLSAATVYLGPEEEGRVIGFSGDTKTLRFVSRISLIPNREQGPVLVHYRILQTDGRQQTLAFFEQPVLTLDSIPTDEPDADAYHPLLTGLADAAWQYRGSDDGREALWRESWDAGDALALPAGVRLQLRRGQEAPLAVVVRIVNPSGE